MLDQERRDAQPVADLPDQVTQVIDLFAIEAGRRLVKQQQLRLGCERAGQFHALAVAERQVADHAIGDLRAGSQSRPARARGRRRNSSSRATIGADKRVRDKAAAGPAWPPSMMFSSTVSEPNNARFWKVRPMPSAGHAVRGRAGQAVPVEDDFALPRAIELG